MIRVLLLVAAFVLAACGSEPAVQEDEPPLYKYASIEAAMSKAQASIDVFWDHHDNRRDGEDVFRVKIIHPSDAYLRDYVWVEYLQPDGENAWRASVSVEDGGNDRFTTGQTLSFNSADIVDWSYVEDGRFRGTFTTRAMLDLAPEANTDSLRKRYHEEPLP